MSRSVIKHYSAKRIESPAINPCIYGQLMYNKEAMNTQWGKSSLQEMVLRKLNSHVKKTKTGPHLTPHMKNNSKCIKDMNVRLETVKLLEKHRF